MTQTKKIISDEKTRGVIAQICRDSYELEALLKEFGEKVLPMYLHGDLAEKKEAIKVLKAKAPRAIMAMGLEQHIPVAETVNERYRPMTLESARKLDQEYNCTTVSEKMIVDVIAGAYARIIEYSALLNRCMSAGISSRERNVFYSIVSKELDRAQRHFLNALTTLKQIKNPNLEVNVKVKNAFVAQNQQVNISADEESLTRETNESK